MARRLFSGKRTDAAGAALAAHRRDRAGRRRAPDRCDLRRHRRRLPAGAPRRPAGGQGKGGDRVASSASTAACRSGSLPSIAIQARDVVLGNAAWGSRADMLRVRRTAIDVSPGALLKGELRIVRIDVEGVDALLESDGAGRYNWQFTPPESATADTKPAPQDVRATRVELERIVASDVLVAYRDGESAPRTLTIETLDLRSNDSGSEVALALSVGTQRWDVEGQVGQAPSCSRGRRTGRLTCDLPATAPPSRPRVPWELEIVLEPSSPTCLPISRPRRHSRPLTPMLPGCRCRSSCARDFGTQGGSCAPNRSTWRSLARPSMDGWR